MRPIKGSAMWGGGSVARSCSGNAELAGGRPLLCKRLDGASETWRKAVFVALSFSGANAFPQYEQ
jgi:hypothetical protein